MGSKPVDLFLDLFGTAVLQTELGRKDDRFRMLTFQDTRSVAVVQLLDGPPAAPAFVQDLGTQQVVRRITVEGSGVAIDRPAHRSGNRRGPFQAGKSPGGSTVCQ